MNIGVNWDSGMGYIGIGLRKNESPLFLFRLARSSTMHENKELNQSRSCLVRVGSGDAFDK